MKKNHKQYSLFAYMAIDYAKVALVFGGVLLAVSMVGAFLSVSMGIDVDTLKDNNVLKILNTFYTLALIGCFIYITNRRLKQYLGALNEAIRDLPNEKRQAEISYTGPREFQEIFDSFNEISEQLHHSRQEQRRLSESKQRMLSDISHDLKTPVTTISGFSKALLDGVVTGAEEKQYLEMIYKKSLHLSELVDLFYEYSRLEHPDFVLHTQREDFCKFLQVHLSQRYMELDESGFSLEADLPEEPVMLTFDRMQMTRAIDNIINNTVKHNPGGTQIFVSLQVREETLILVLADGGSGIPDSLRDSLFDPFTTADHSRNHSKGSGLGLSITKKIIERHGGTIQLLPPDGSWKTRFEIQILYK